MSTLPSTDLPSTDSASTSLETLAPTLADPPHPNRDFSLRRHRHLAISPLAAAAIASALAILGLATISSPILSLWSLWTTDPLKSIGMVVPAVSFVLILRAWRRLGWEIDGSGACWWGLALLVTIAVLVRLRDQTVLVLILSPQWSLYFPPNSLVVFLYGVGLVLLFGGPRLVRESLFPLTLLLFSNPIPHVFNVWVDLPLQRASAHIARGFAMALGQPLSPDKLHLMFTPSFGMFIAPGCNGIRGAVTMGFIALVAGYLYRFRWSTHATVVLGAIALGYLFNLLRLCVLVLFYMLALHLPSLQDHAENADYLIGAALFFLAVFLLYTIIQRLGRSPRTQQAETVAAQTPAPSLPASFYPRTAAMFVLAAIGLGLLIHTLTAPGASAAVLADERSIGQFPQTAGSYTLLRTWNENLLTGALLFHWAEYAPTAAPGTHIAIGISPVLGSHDTLICHSARGEDPLWHGQQTLKTEAPEPVNFSTAFYNDGATQFIEATTLCNGASCGEYSTPSAHFGFVWSKPHPETLFSQDPQRPIPILVKAETIDTTLPANAARQQLSADVSAFLAGIDLDALTQPYRRR
jgi:exosortase J